MPASVISPASPYEQPAGHLASSPRPYGESTLLGGSGRRSVLPPLTRSRSPPARSSSPRHRHSAASNANQQLPTTTPARYSSPSTRYERTVSTSLTEEPGVWGEDTISDNSLFTLLENPYDHYLAVEPDVEPELTSFNLPPRRSTLTAGADIVGAGTSQSQGYNIPSAGPSRSETQLTATTWNDTLTTQFSEDIFGDDALPDSSQTSFSESMPAVRKRNAPTREDSRDAKRPRASAPGRVGTPIQRHDSCAKQNTTTTADLDLEDLFGESPKDVNYIEDDSAQEELATIDLTEANEVPEDLKKSDEDKRIKLSAFQCVICMDDVTTLTVTHCGHLYCAQCLHSSLHVEATKGKCPMCRSKIDIKSRSAYTSKTKGYWPLELKLMTTTRKGKRKANTTT
ncbi:E3 ubiquitin-protein ligase complex slx8-rfp subunit slx8 [Paramyrothecium foliicola]|nr:E3 ubiquitin-protein ligase complex slx8-rfp subunit slx8 [Paramyrothecium foliicola]